MNENKKKILIIVGAIVAVVLIAVGVAFAIKLVNDKKIIEEPVTSETLEAVKSQAIQALDTNPEQARDLWEETKEQAEQLQDTDNKVDAEAQLWLLDHPVE